MDDGTLQRGWGLGKSAVGSQERRVQRCWPDGGQTTVDSQPMSSLILKSSVLGWVNGNIVRVL